jgi:hypothetical protein
MKIVYIEPICEENPGDSIVMYGSNGDTDSELLSKAARCYSHYDRFTIKSEPLAPSTKWLMERKKNAVLVGCNGGGTAIKLR